MRPIALYLPQYHPIPENDEWWGKDFTEWTNVRKAKSLFKNHYQPHVPGELGYYDLRSSPETMEKQATLAKEHGIHGFCYYHYWFNGKLLLETPLKHMLSSGQPDMPFCLCWANENWTRRWDGQDQHVLIEQQYSLDDDREHIRYLIDFFKDKRYITINGNPVLLVYRSELHPDIINATEIWREEVLKAGFNGLYLIRVENFMRDIDPATHGFDAGMEFAPDMSKSGGKYYKKKNIISYGLSKCLHNCNIRKFGYIENKVFSYDRLVDNMLNRPSVPYKRFRSVCPSWDNSARRKSGASILIGSTPDKFKTWVHEIAECTSDAFEGDEQVFFINAWNEWGEGCHLEPDQRHGLAYLQAFKDGLGLYYDND